MTELRRFYRIRSILATGIWNLTLPLYNINQNFTNFRISGLKMSKDIQFNVLLLIRFHRLCKAKVFEIWRFASSISKNPISVSTFCSFLLIGSGRSNCKIAGIDHVSVLSSCIRRTVTFLISAFCRLSMAATSSWSCENVARWLKSVGFEQYIDFFYTNQIDGRTLLSLTKEDLFLLTKIFDDIFTLAGVLNIERRLNQLRRKNLRLAVHVAFKMWTIFLL